MSRIPQPASHNPPSPKKPSSLSTPTSKTRPKPPPSPTPTPALRPKPSLKTLKPKSPAVSRRTPPLPSPTHAPPSKPLSIREQIALKRAQAKDAAGRSGSPASGSDFGSLEDADPTTLKKRPEDAMIDLGRWSVKETIERARSSGQCSFLSHAGLSGSSYRRR